MSGKTTTYHIIGGGIAGLAAAKFIKNKNIKNKVILYEASAKLGGRCYSFFDTKLDRTIDNATHVILGANSETLRLINTPHFSGKAHFFENGTINSKFWKYKDFILLSVFNTKPENIPFPLIRKLFWKLFPFFPYKLKICYSQSDLTSKLIEPLSRYADEIKLNCKLLNFTAEKELISALRFNKGEVAIAPQDKIICALDAANYSRIFGGPKFEFNEITNIFYRTSMPITLPDNHKFIATPQNIADWIFINNDIVAATISNSGDFKEEDDDELARKIWIEIRALNGLKPAFLPPYRVLRYKQATIKQDYKNNLLRPVSAESNYKNMKLSGDWTMKNWPCCLEAAVISAKRATQ